MEQIIAQLNEVFAKYDEDYKAKQIAWLNERLDGFKEFRANLDKLSKANDFCTYYGKLYDYFGGKTMYNRLRGHSREGVIAEMVKMCDRTIAARNATIASKLLKAEITEVLESTFAYTNDGFNGRFSVITNSGKKVVHIDTIVAGGYNIQCVHYRTLVKVK